MDLTQPLFELLLSGPDRPPTSASAQHEAIARAGADRWARALDALAPHKVFPLLTHRLSASGLLDGVPAASRERLVALHTEVRGRNTTLLLTLANVLRATRAKNEQVLLLKGILFADSYYPDPSTRPMSDLDLVAQPGRDEVLFEILGEAGFRPSLHHVVQAHSVTFLNKEGVFCDAHRTLPLFAREPWSQIARPVTLKRVRGVQALALEPNAMIAHLAAHMAVHAPDLGFVLLWIIDLAFALRHAGLELDARRIHRLCGSPTAWALFLRIVGLLERAGERLPLELTRAARLLPPLTLGAVLRARRLVPWGLPAPLGWARLVAHQLGIHRSERPEPQGSDLVLWPLDKLATFVAPPLGRVLGR
ncbi:MAG: nucleotidyltransferase family protein [Polyangiales bacterium]